VSWNFVSSVDEQKPSYFLYELEHSFEEFVKCWRVDLYLNCDDMKYLDNSTEEDEYMNDGWCCLLNEYSFIAFLCGKDNNKK
jgi:hypothetical protein